MPEIGRTITVNRAPFDTDSYRIIGLPFICHKPSHSSTARSELPDPSGGLSIA